jgi:signal peptidase I
MVMSNSMAPTLGAGELALVFSPPTRRVPLWRGQVVLAALPRELQIGSGVPPGHRFIKRIVALAGDTVEGHGEAGIFVNGRPLPRPSPQPTEEFKIVAGRAVQRLGGDSWWLGGPSRPWLNPVDDPALARRLQASPPEPLPAGTVLLLGDNGAESIDGRHWGPLPAECVHGWVVAAVPPPPLLRRLLPKAVSPTPSPS